MVIDTQKVAEEKGLVFDDRPPDIGAVVVVNGGRLWRDGRVLEERHRRQRANPIDLIGRAVKFIRSTLEYDVRDRPIRSAQLRVVVAGGHIHSLDGFNRWNVDGQKPGALVVVQTLELQVVGQPRLPIYFGPEAVLRVEKR